MTQRWRAGVKYMHNVACLDHHSYLFRRGCEVGRRVGCEVSFRAGRLGRIGL